jgi:tRNA-specific adenosine deaminase 2
MDNNGDETIAQGHDSDQRIRFMKAALHQAELAIQHGEVPVGCVFADESEDRILTEGFNLTNETRNGTRHAELVAMDKLIFRNRGDPAALSKCTLYVTCEPCIMCAAAIAKVGIKKVVFGCHNDRFGGNGSILSIHNSTALSAHSYDVVAGVMKDDAILLFQNFYECENRRAPESKRRKKAGH